MKKIFRILASISLVCFCYISGVVFEEPESTYYEEIIIEDISETPIYYEEIVIEDISGTPAPDIKLSRMQKNNYTCLSEDEIELIALITIAEAEGQCEEGKRLVIDSILNRVDHEQIPNTVQEVIFQENQYSCVWNGRINRCQVTNEVIDLVNEELSFRTNNDVIFFRTGRYSSYGSPLFQVEDHYFSSY